MENKITPKEVCFSVACFIQGSILLNSYSIEISRQENFITLILAYLISIGVIWLYAGLIKKYPGKSLVQINKEVYGKTAGGIISGLYIFFLLSLTALNLRHISDFLATWIMTDTPLYAIMISFMVVTGYAVKKGIEKITSISFIMLVASFIIIALTVSFLISSIRKDNFLPLFSLPFERYVHSTHMLLISPFCETVTFLMLAPKFSKPQKSMKAFFFGLTIAMITMLALSLVVAGVLGNAQEILAQPIYELVRFINIFDVFTRIEIIFAFFIVIMQFFKVSICYYASNISIKELFAIKKPRNIVFILGAFIVCYALTVFSSGVELGNWRKGASPFFSSIFEILLPSITLFIAYIKGRKNQICKGR